MGDPATRAGRRRSLAFHVDQLLLRRLFGLWGGREAAAEAAVAAVDGEDAAAVHLGLLSPLHLVLGAASGTAAVLLRAVPPAAFVIYLVLSAAMALSAFHLVCWVSASLRSSYRGPRTASAEVMTAMLFATSAAVFSFIPLGW